VTVSLKSKRLSFSLKKTKSGTFEVFKPKPRYFYNPFLSPGCSAVRRKRKRRVLCDTLRDFIDPWSVTVWGKANKASSLRVGRRCHCSVNGLEQPLVRSSIMNRKSYIRIKQQNPPQFSLCNRMVSFLKLGLGILVSFFYLCNVHAMLSKNVGLIVHRK